MQMHVGILTGGGDCPGLNAVIRAVTLALVNECDARVTGIERGFAGLVERRARPLGPSTVAGILAQGGTILGTHNRADPFHWPGAGGADVSARALAFARDELRLDALVAIGGDGTMAIAHRMHALGLPVVGVPKTIDNDLAGTDLSFGFDSAVAVVAEALDRLETTARSHGRVMIAETMGRNAGWLALHGGLAGAADMILLPELPYRVDAVVERCRARAGNPGWTLICVAEGAHAEGEAPVYAASARAGDPQRLGGIGARLQQQLAAALDVEVRATLLGHTQRGGAPTAFDRVLATRLGWHAAEQLRRGGFGRMVALQGDAITAVPLVEVSGRSRPVSADHPLLATARGLGISFGR